MSYAACRFNCIKPCAEPRGGAGVKRQINFFVAVAYFFLWFRPELLLEEIKRFFFFIACDIIRHENEKKKKTFDL